MATRALGNYLSPAAISRLEQDLPDLREWSAQLLVPFRAQRLRGASVAWLNRRWFQERLFDLDDAPTRERIHDWVLREFAFVSASRTEGHVSLATSESKTIFADRYGSSDGLAPHGGSGRVAIVGRFQCKGIGQTPLVSPEAPGGHSHGCISLAEAIREAIFSEIATVEFPHGAVPVIAIIDTGLTFSSPDPDDQYDQQVPRAIMVRPAAIRIAHAERAPMFKTSISGFKNIQANDVLRTQDVINSWMTTAASRSDTPSGDFETIQLLLSHVAEQIAFGQVNRLFSGGYFSSNLTIQGELIDFGNTHALQNWSYAQVHSVVEGFGKEMILLKSLVNSIAFYVTKYRRNGNNIQWTIQLYDHAQQIYKAAWKRYSLNLFQANQFHESAQNALRNALLSYYESQQRQYVTYRFGKIVTTSVREPRTWLYDGITGKANNSFGSHEIKTLQIANNILRTMTTMRQRKTAWYTASRLLKPRFSLDRFKLLKELRQITYERKTSSFGVAIDDYICKAINAGRRYWRGLPNGYGVLAQATRHGSSALLLMAGGGMDRKAWIEGMVGTDGALVFFQERLSSTEGDLINARRHGRYWSALVDVESRDGRLGVCVSSRIVWLPPMTESYDKPSDKWLS